MASQSRQRVAGVLIFFAIILLWHFRTAAPDEVTLLINDYQPRVTRWTDYQYRNPVPAEQFQRLPKGSRRTPRIQKRAFSESRAQKKERLLRLDAVREAFLHSWNGYKLHAYGHDEVQPVFGRAKDNYGGWGATLVDSLDTLWIMGLKEEFAEAVNFAATIDYSTTEHDAVSVFETTIRFLGGLLSAYDVSGQRYHVLLHKAVELGDFLYMAFDTPNRTPVPHFSWKQYLEAPIEASRSTCIADIGSLSLEFTRLSQLTGDDKYFDAVQRLTDHFERTQMQTEFPGLWPTTVDAKEFEFKSGEFSLGPLADSMYEYLPKMHLLLGGQSTQTLDMYEKVLAASKAYVFFKHMNPENQTLVMAGLLRGSADAPNLAPRVEHLTCFVGGMVGLGARAMGNKEDMALARQLTDTCIWAYSAMPSGVMPEVYIALGCSLDSECAWNETAWHMSINPRIGASIDYAEQSRLVATQRGLAPGMTSIEDTRYKLRPEAVESVFLLYRMTGDRTLLDHAWDMFSSIDRSARTKIAHGEVSDVRRENSTINDSMESFWTAETLKYLYLTFSKPSHISLDKYVFNTEAHPLLYG